MARTYTNGRLTVIDHFDEKKFSRDTRDIMSETIGYLSYGNSPSPIPQLGSWVIDWMTESRYAVVFMNGSDYITLCKGKVHPTGISIQGDLDTELRKVALPIFVDQARGHFGKRVSVIHNPMDTIQHTLGEEVSIRGCGLDQISTDASSFTAYINRGGNSTWSVPEALDPKNLIRVEIIDDKEFRVTRETDSRFPVDQRSIEGSLDGLIIDLSRDSSFTDWAEKVGLFSGRYDIGGDVLKIVRSMINMRTATFFYSTRPF